MANHTDGPVVDVVKSKSAAPCSETSSAPTLSSTTREKSHDEE
jgi:hypothetical protein